MFRLLDGIIRSVVDCDESVRLILTTAVLVTLILGGIALHNFYGGCMVGFGTGIILISLAGVMYEDYLERQSRRE